MEEQIQCPKCGSTQLSANKKGWTVATGMIGSSKILLTCLKCGKQFKPGFDKVAMELKKKQQAEMVKKPGFWIFFSVLIILLLFAFRSCTAQSIGGEYAGGTVYRIDATGKHGSVFKIIADSVTYDQALHAIDSLKGWRLSNITDWGGLNGMTGIQEIKRTYNIHFPGLYYWLKTGTESSTNADGITAAGNFSSVGFNRKKSRIGLLVVHAF